MEEMDSIYRSDYIIVPITTTTFRSVVSEIAGDK